MLPSLNDLDAQIELAEQEVIRSDQRVRREASALKQRWTARAPMMVAVAVSGLIASLFLRPRRGSAGVRRKPPMLGLHRLLVPLIDIGIARGAAVLTALVAGFTARKKATPPVTVPHVDLARYAGLWYEVARLPLMHERACASDVTALYERTGDALRVINRCRRADGRIKTAVGRARIVDARTCAKLQVSYAPALLDSLPFVWGEYWIIDLVDDYSAALVGTPDRKHLWLLARTGAMPRAQLEAFLARAEQQGYDISKLERTRHAAPPAALAPQTTAETSPQTEPELRTTATVD